MTNSNEIQTAYNNIYKAMRQYIWEFEAVNALADFEVECYQAFPDLLKLNQKYNRLKLYAKNCFDDKEFKKPFDDFEKLLKNTDGLFVKLTQVNEVIV